MNHLDGRFFCLVTGKQVKVWVLKRDKYTLQEKKEEHCSFHILEFQSYQYKPF